MTDVSVTGRTESRHPPAGGGRRNVIANVERLRQARHLSLRQLSARLAELGRPTLTSVVHWMLQGGRRVDVDDLVALADSLEVSPADLLAPPSGAEILSGSHPALRDAGLIQQCAAASMACRLISVAYPSAAHGRT